MIYRIQPSRNGHKKWEARITIPGDQPENPYELDAGYTFARTMDRVILKAVKRLLKEPNCEKIEIPFTGRMS